MVLFLLYVTIHEVNTLFGDGELYRLFLRWRSSEAKLNRRRRIRLLIELNRLTEANWVHAISERGSPPNTKVVAILHELASLLVGSTMHETHGMPETEPFEYTAGRTIRIPYENPDGLVRGAAQPSPVDIQSQGRL